MDNGTETPVDISLAVGKTSTDGVELLFTLRFGEANLMLNAGSSVICGLNGCKVKVHFNKGEMSTRNPKLEAEFEFENKFKFENTQEQKNETGVKAGGGLGGPSIDVSSTSTNSRGLNKQYEKVKGFVNSTGSDAFPNWQFNADDLNEILFCSVNECFGSVTVIREPCLAVASVNIWPKHLVITDSNNIRGKILKSWLKYSFFKKMVVKQFLEAVGEKNLTSEVKLK
jgi:hypothetical protein